MEDAAPQGDIFVTATGNLDVITLDHMREMKDHAIVCNIGHFDSEIQIGALKNFKWDEIKPQVDEVEFPDGKKLIILSKGRLVNLGNAMGHPSFVMSASFTNQVLAQNELWNNTGTYEKKVYVLVQRTGRKGRGTAPEEARRPPFGPQRQAVRIPQPRQRRPVQARALPVLANGVNHCDRWNPAQSPGFHRFDSAPTQKRSGATSLLRYSLPIL